MHSKYQLQMLSDWVRILKLVMTTILLVEQSEKNASSKTCHNGFLPCVGNLGICLLAGMCGQCYKSEYNKIVVLQIGTRRLTGQLVFWEKGNGQMHRRGED